MRRGKQAGSRRENGSPSGAMHLCFPERNTESPCSPPLSLSLLFFPKRAFPSVPRFPCLLPPVTSGHGWEKPSNRSSPPRIDYSTSPRAETCISPLSIHLFYSSFFFFFFISFPPFLPPFFLFVQRRGFSRGKERDISRCVALANEEIILIGGGLIKGKSIWGEKVAGNQFAS